MITLHIVNLIALLTIVAFICYYLGKGNIQFTKKITMTNEQFAEIKKIEKERTNKYAQIDALMAYQDPEFEN